MSPDWKCSIDIRPIIETDSCQATHAGAIVSGSIYWICDDRSEATCEAGDAYAISPGRNAWVQGSEPPVFYEFAGMCGE